MSGGGESGRLHHLDALRGLAMVLILPAHAIALLGLRSGWNDLEASAFWLIHVFRLPLFFLVAGFFAALLLAGRGQRALLRNRAIRIGIPFAVGVLFAVPLLTIGLQAASEAPYRPEATGLAAFADPHPSYLWFLWYLAWIYAGALLLRGLAPKLPGVRAGLRRHLHSFLSHWSAPLLLAVPTAALLYWQPRWIAGTPADGFAPQVDLLAYYATFFACGWALFAIGGLRDAIEAQPWRYTALAAIALPPALALYLLQGEPAIGPSRWLHALAILLLSVSTWSLVFGLLGLSRRFLREPNPRLRYWADASYWIYLSHFLPMTVLALVLFEIAMPDGLRAGVLIVATMLLIYPAYGAFVRHSAVGRVLHGPRPPRKARAAEQRPLVSSAAPLDRRISS